MESLAVISVLRNEASRWLQSTLTAWADFADVIVALDDGSDDATPALLQACPKVQYHRRDSLPMWGQEAPVRQALWRLGVAANTDWLMILDADMVPACSPRSLMVQPADAIAFKLYDLWSLQPALYRHDSHWQAHHCPRIWAVRNPGSVFDDQWPERGIHCGHLPMNLQGSRLIYAPDEYSLLHAAYSDAESRQQKAEQYAAKAWQLTQTEQEHAASILDSLVHLAPVPFPIEWPIVKAAV